MHEKLLQTNQAYARWHQWAGATAFHWIALILIAAGAGQALTAQINASSNLAATGAAFSTDTPTYPNLPPLEAQDHIFVKFKSNMSATAQAAILAHNKNKVIGVIKELGIETLSVSPDDTPDEAIQRLKANNAKDIDFVEPAYAGTPNTIPNDPNYSSQWNLSDINAPAGWDISTGSPAVVIATIDYGVQPDHPDLVGKLLTGYNYYTGTTNTADTNSHGTEVACIASAVTNNAIGMAGVSWNSQIIPFVTCSAGYCDSQTSPQGTDMLAQALTDAANKGVKVATISWGSKSYNPSTWQSAINYAWSKGMVIVVAAGNFGSSGGIPSYPASDDHVVSVAALGTGDNLASFSSYGSWLTVSAPGVNIPACNNSSGYWAPSGTSPAAPQVAGLAALVFATNPSLCNSQVVNLIEQNADDLGAPGFDSTYGWGKIDVAKTLAAAKTTAGQCTTGNQPPPPPDTTPPSAPTNLTASAPNSSSVNLSWGPSTDNVGVAGYKVYRGGSQITTTTKTNYTDSTVVGGQSYTYQVFAYDAAGNTSTSSNSATVIVPAALPTISITSFSVSSKTGTTATISWTTDKLSTGTVSYGTGSLNLSASDASVSTTHNLTLTGLGTHASYTYQIKAVSQDGALTTLSPVSTFRTMPH